MQNFKRSEKGSMTLEAALIVPVCLLFVIFLAGMIRIGIAEMALNRAVSDTTEVIATHAYPAGMLIAQGKGALDTYIQNQTMGLANLNQAKKVFQSAFGSVKLNFSPQKFIAKLAKENFLTPMVRKKFGESFVGNLFATKNVEVVDVKLTNGLSGGIEITAQYKMNLVAPFVDKEIILKKRAYEKLWVPSG